MRLSKLLCGNISRWDRSGIFKNDTGRMPWSYSIEFNCFRYLGLPAGRAISRQRVFVVWEKKYFVKRFQNMNALREVIFSSLGLRSLLSSSFHPLTSTPCTPQT